jgi:hypothetical protein
MACDISGTAHVARLAETSLTSLIVDGPAKPPSTFADLAPSVNERFTTLG